MKPISCGGLEDAHALAEASEFAGPITEINPVAFDQPVSPFTAAVLSGRQISLSDIFDAFRALESRHDCVVVEGAGGWMVPILPNYFMADLAVEFGLPVLIVAENKLGTLNHTLLTVDSLQRRGVPCAGLVLNNRQHRRDEASASNRAVLETLLPIPIRAELEVGQTSLDMSGFADLLK
jgi:dethiobiotin synthetase